MISYRGSLFGPLLRPLLAQICLLEPVARLWTPQKPLNPGFLTLWAGRPPGFWTLGLDFGPLRLIDPLDLRNPPSGPSKIDPQLADHPDPRILDPQAGFLALTPKFDHLDP